MPFKSKAQQGYMFAKEPELAKKWAKETPNIADLPTKVDEDSCPKKKKDSYGCGGLGFISNADDNEQPNIEADGDSGMGEANVAASGKGFAGPGGPLVKREFDPEGPQNENFDLKKYIEACVKEICDEEEFEEVLRKHGDQWQVVHPDTDVVVGTYDNREQGREANRIFRQRTKREKDFQKSFEKSKKATTLNHPKQKETPGNMRENLEEARLFNEEISDYDEFSQGISQDSILSDPKLHRLIKDIKDKEIKVLTLAYNKIKEKLGKSRWGYELLDKKITKDEQNRNAFIFSISLPKTKNKLEGIILRLTDGKPTIELSEQIKNILRQLNNDESKYLRAELIHLQEDELEKINTIALLIAKRDMYLADREKDLDDYVSQLTLLEVAILKRLLKNKYAGIK